MEHNGIDWPERIKVMQRNWVGKSAGTEISFALERHEDEEIRVFTTRPDTTFGVTFMVLAPEHPLVAKLTTPDRKAEKIAKSAEETVKIYRKTSEKAIEKAEVTTKSAEEIVEESKRALQEAISPVAYFLSPAYCFLGYSYRLLSRLFGQFTQFISSSYRFPKCLS
ncbi:unnamed protein product, partial [marine sediment metagenome]